MTKADAYFAVVPEAMIGNVKPRALEVYCVLRRHADYASSETFVGIKTIAERLHCHPDTVSGALDELAEKGWIEVETRHTRTGRRTTNLYTVRSLPLGVGRESSGYVPGDDSGDVPGVSSGTLIESQSDDSQSKSAVVALADVSTIAARRDAYSSDGQYHDAMVFALMHAHGWQHEQVTEPQWGRLHKAAKHLTAIDADVGDVPHRALVYRANFAGATMSPNAIATNWADLAAVHKQASKRRIKNASTRADTRAALAALDEPNADGRVTI